MAQWVAQGKAARWGGARGDRHQTASAQGDGRQALQHLAVANTAPPQKQNRNSISAAHQRPAPLPLRTWNASISSAVWSSGAL